MKTSDMIQSRFIRKEDLKSAPMTLTIRDCTLEEFGAGGRSSTGADNKWCLWFREADKGITLNTTKIRLLEAAFGDDSDYWIGKRVRLHYDPSVIMAGQVVGGIRLECSRAPPAGQNMTATEVQLRRAEHGHNPLAGQGHPMPEQNRDAPPASWEGSPQGAVSPDANRHPAFPPRPQTISERVAANFPVGGGIQPDPEAPEFDDEIPF